MSDPVTFKIKTRTVTYGDNRKFVQFAILFLFNNRVVGIENGPHRSTESRAAAIKAARPRIAELKKHRLFVIDVTKKHIADGEPRSCSTCAIAQALWHNQERMGFPKRDYNFHVEPYGFFRADGLTLKTRWGSESETLAITADALPDMVYIKAKPHDVSLLYPSSMMEWAMQFDDWAEMKSQGAKSWREDHPDEDYLPSRPDPMAFVLDLDAFKPLHADA